MDARRDARVEGRPFSSARERNANRRHAEAYDAVLRQLSEVPVARRRARRRLGIVVAMFVAALAGWCIADPSTSGEDALPDEVGGVVGQFRATTPPSP